MQTLSQKKEEEGEEEKRMKRKRKKRKRNLGRENFDQTMIYEFSFKKRKFKEPCTFRQQQLKKKKEVHIGNWGLVSGRAFA